MSRSADADTQATGEALVRLLRLTRVMPDLIVVQAHDVRAWKALPQLAPTRASQAPEAPIG